MKGQMLKKISHAETEDRAATFARGSQRLLSAALLFSIVMACGFVGVFASVPAPAYAQSIGGSSSLHQVRLDSKLLGTDIRIVGNSVIAEAPTTTVQGLQTSPTTIESRFSIKVRALGGDILLPTYREDVVFSPFFFEPQQGSNAIVPGAVSITLKKQLPEVKDSYLLKEYNEVEMDIVLTYKVVPQAMTSKVVFASELKSLLWTPARYADGSYDGGFNPNTDMRTSVIPLVSAGGALQQVSRLDYRTEAVILLKENSAITSLKKGGISSIKNALKRIFGPSF